ncbi:MAG: D-alanyl-D-alanine carboxypeptidase [Cognaticolwellia sp.]|jgi:D-alanyl-D-alanine carboxypeptidase
MKYIKYSILIITLSIISSCGKVSIEPTTTCINDATITINDSHPKATELQAIMDKYIAKGIPGVSVLINDDDGFWMASAGMADIENSIEMQPCHINKLGSITKMMLGTLVWQLIQDGTLNIDDKMSKHLPDVANKIENGDDITLGMLINHTSGIYDIARDLGYNLAVINDMTRSWTEEDILNYIEGKTPTNLPGEEVNYSNSNTMLVGMIIEAATGHQHGALLKSRIFEPIGMDNTVYFDYSNNFPITHLAQGYLDLNNDGGSIQNISNLNPGSGNGYTGVYSTVTDLYRFMNALLREKTLITPDNLEFIFDNMVEANSGSWKSSYGAIHDEQRNLLGENIHAYGHGGGDIGYSANLDFFPHNNTIFAATFNYGTNLPSALGGEVNELRKELYLKMAE